MVLPPETRLATKGGLRSGVSKRLAMRWPSRWWTAMSGRSAATAEALCEGHAHHERTHQAGAGGHADGGQVGRSQGVAAKVRAGAGPGSPPARRRWPRCACDWQSRVPRRQSGRGSQSEWPPRSRRPHRGSPSRPLRSRRRRTRSESTIGPAAASASRQASLRSPGTMGQGRMDGARLRTLRPPARRQRQAAAPRAG